MESEELIQQLEAIIAAQRKKHTTQQEDESESKSNLQENKKGFWSQFLSMLSSPFLFVLKYFKSELTDAIKHDFKRAVFLFHLTLVLSSFIVVAWMSAQYLFVLWLKTYELSTFQAVFISLGFQLICILSLFLFMRSSSKKMETIAVVNRLKTSD